MFRSKRRKLQLKQMVIMLIVLQENGVKLIVSITDTPGFGDQVNNDNCWEPIAKHIKDQYSLYLRKELF